MAGGRFTLQNINSERREFNPEVHWTRGEDQKMSSIDDIWASMNEDVHAHKTSAAVAKKPKKNKVKTNKAEQTTFDASSEKKETLSYAAMTAKIARDVQACEEAEIGVRKKALSRLYSTLFIEYDMTEEHYNEVFRDICKKLFKRFADPSEKCRELAQKTTLAFFERCTDIVPTLGYYIPALLQRIPSGYGYDEEMKVFVSDMAEHDAYRRGRAVDRQDRSGTVGTVVHSVVEPSEEIRLLNCLTLFGLIKRVCAIHACPVLHPYFQEIIMFLQIQLKDPYPDLKVAACNALELLAKTEEYEQGMKFFSVALVRSILPVLRHRLAKVRVASIAAMHICMVVPDRAKRKAAGSEAITDLVGFREDNVLPIASFYKAEVQVNHLAELVIDKSLPVREELAKFLYILLTEIGDRYDHHTRLLPYVLDLLTDESASVANVALATLQKCGKEYESEHEDEIRDRLQYGVDGDNRINLDKPLPSPFLERPRLGMRLYIRGTSKRFLSALVNELTNWVSTTRLKSAQLLKVLVVLCEEHLTMEAHTLFPAFIKALKFAHDDKDVALASVLKELFELVGRYILPEVYIYYILPRLRGDADVVAFGVDVPTRIVVMEFLEALLSGSKASMIVPHLDELVTTITDAFVVPLDSPQLQSAATTLLRGIFSAVRGKGTKVIEAHYVATGRLSSLKGTVRRAFRFLLLQLSFPVLASRAWEALQSLSELEADHGLGIANLYQQHSCALLQEAIADYEVDALWSPSNSAEHLLLSRLLQPPVESGLPIHRDAATLLQLIEFLIAVLTQELDVATEVENSLSISISDLLIAVLHPVTTTAYLSSTEAEAVISTCAEKLLDTFVYDRRWLRSPTLLQQSMNVLTLLLKAPLEVTPKENHLSKLFKVTLDEEIAAEDAEIAKAILRGDSLLRNIYRILNITLVSAMVPTIPASQRSESLTLVDHALHVLRAHCGRTKLKSFVFYEKADTADEQGTERALKVLTCKLAVQQGLLQLLAGLNDSDDSVRNSCIQTLSSAVPFVFSETEIARLRADDRLLQTVRTMGSMPSTQSMENVTEYKNVVTTLLQQVLLPGVHANSEYMAYLNDTLRVACVLDPNAFEAIVRTELAPRLAPPTPLSTIGDELARDDTIDKDDLNAFVSGLLTHVELLLQFQ